MSAKRWTDKIGWVIEIPLNMDKEKLELLKESVETRLNMMLNEKCELQNDLAQLEKDMASLKEILGMIGTEAIEQIGLQTQEKLASVQGNTQQQSNAPLQHPYGELPSDEVSQKKATEQRTPTEHKPVALLSEEVVKKPTVVEKQRDKTAFEKRIINSEAIKEEAKTPEPEPLEFVPPKENIERVKRKQEEEKKKKEKVGNLTLKVAVYDELKNTGEVRLKEIFDKFEGKVKINRIKRAFDTVLLKHSGLMALKDKKGEIYGLKDEEGKMRKPEETKEEKKNDDEESTWFSPSNWAEVWDLLRNEPDKVYTVEGVSLRKDMPGILVKSIFRDLKGKKMIEEFEPGKFRVSKGMGD